MADGGLLGLGVGEATASSAEARPRCRPEAVSKTLYMQAAFFGVGIVGSIT